MVRLRVNCTSRRQLHHHHHQCVVWKALIPQSKTNPRPWPGDYTPYLAIMPSPYVVFLLTHSS